MTALYLVAQEYQQDLAKLADLDLDPQTLADTLESLGGELQIKAQNVALFVRGLEAEASAVKQWAKDAADRAKAMESRAERVREYMASHLEACGIEKIEGPGISIGWRKSSAVVIDCPDLIPVQFTRQKPPPPLEADKAAIAAAIKAGIEVPGAHIEQRRSLSIK